MDATWATQPIGDDFFTKCEYIHLTSSKAAAGKPNLTGFPIIKFPAHSFPILLLPLRRPHDASVMTTMGNRHEHATIANYLWFRTDPVGDSAFRQVPIRVAYGTVCFVSQCHDQLWSD